MISEKMKYFTANSSAIRAMFEEGKRLSAIYGAENVYDFSIGNPSVEPPPSVKNTIFKILSEESPNFVHGYTNNSGYEDVRTAIADAVNQEFSTNYQKEQIVMTNGAAGGLNILFKTLLNPGDEVIVFVPYFSEYGSYTRNYDGVLVPVAADPETFQIDFDALEQALSEKTKLVVINSPNNPTGVIYTEEALKNLSALLSAQEKKVGHPIYLISDEPYRRIVFDGKTVPFVPNYYAHSFVAYSYSKALSLPGERIGYLLLSPELPDAAEIQAALNVANRICGFVNAPSLFQRVLKTCVNDCCDISIYEKNRDLLYDMLTSLGFSAVKPEGAFYLFPKSLIPEDEKFCQIAKKYRLLLVPGSSFGCPGHVRLSFCVSEETIKNSYDSFVQLQKQLGGK